MTTVGLPLRRHNHPHMKSKRSIYSGMILFVISLCIFTGDRLAAQSAQKSTVRDAVTDIMQLVNEAGAVLGLKGESAFKDFRATGSRWNKGDRYIFVLDRAGNMLVHNDPGMEGRNHLELRDVNGKYIVKGILASATTLSPEGWYHYQWPEPNGILPRWKSTYSTLVKAPSGKEYIVSCGMYDDRMQRIFVVDMVQDAVAKITERGKLSFPLFHDPQGPFIAKDAYVFVIDAKGVDLVNPGFPNLEGRNIMDHKDTQGKYLIREMWKMVRDSGSGWVDYMWPKPGESASTQKSAFVSTAKIGEQTVLVGSGVYLSDAPKAAPSAKKMKAADLMSLVREAASVLEQKGEKAFPEFRQKGTKWNRDDTYLFVWTLTGIRVMHGADPKSEGANVRDLKDNLDRPYGRMFLDTASTDKGEGWVHYMNTEPGDIFPVWKSSFIKRVTFPSGEMHMIGCGIYNMEMDRTFIEDLVNRSAKLVETEGRAAFPKLRDKTGPYRFMDIYVFVDDHRGVELVNPAQPSLEGKNLMNIKDAKGNFMVRNYVNSALNKGSAWTEYHWYRPGENTVTRKLTYVRRVKVGKDTYIVGSGYYPSK